MASAAVAAACGGSNAADADTLVHSASKEHAAAPAGADAFPVRPR
jgi:hypothetical protein